MWLFCLLDPFIHTRIKFLAKPLTISSMFCRTQPNFQVSPENYVNSHTKTSNGCSK